PACRGQLRPDIVWFGEGLPEYVWYASRLAARECDAFLVVGTSAVVHPAASLVPLSQSASKAVPAKVIEVNLTRTAASAYAGVARTHTARDCDSAATGRPDRTAQRRPGGSPDPRATAAAQADRRVRGAPGGFGREGRGLLPP